MKYIQLAVMVTALIFIAACTGKPVSQVQETPELSKSVLAEVSISSEPKVKVMPLEEKVARLSGKFTPNIEFVDNVLAGASFTQVPWKKNIEYKITVLRAGYLYTMKGSKEQRELSNLNWEAVPEIVKGSYLKGADRVMLDKGQTIQLKGYELGLIAEKIIIQQLLWRD